MSALDFDHAEAARVLANKSLMEKAERLASEFLPELKTKVSALIADGTLQRDISLLATLTAGTPVIGWVLSIGGPLLLGGLKSILS